MARATFISYGPASLIVLATLWGACGGSSSVVIGPVDGGDDGAGSGSGSGGSNSSSSGVMSGSSSGTGSSGSGGTAGGSSGGAGSGSGSGGNDGSSSGSGSGGSSGSGSGSGSSSGGGSGGSSGSGSGGSSGSSSGSSSGGSSGSSSGGGSGSSSGGGNTGPDCPTSPCTKPNVCCFDSKTTTASCQTTCPSGDALACLTPADCPGATCCGTADLSGGKPPQCDVGSLTTRCTTSTCDSSFSLMCTGGMDTLHICGAATDCAGDTANPNCCSLNGLYVCFPYNTGSCK